MPDSAEKPVKLTRAQREALARSVDEIESIMPMAVNDWQSYTGWSFTPPEAKVLLKVARSVLGRAHSTVAKG